MEVFTIAQRLRHFVKLVKKLPEQWRQTDHECKTQGYEIKKTSDTHDQITLKFNANINDLLNYDPKIHTSPEEAFDENKSSIQKEVFRMLDCEYLPEFINDNTVYGMSSKHDESYSTKAKTKINNNWETNIEDGVAGIHNDLMVTIL